MGAVGIMSIKTRLRSHRKNCHRKLRLSLEEAPAYLLAAQKDTTRYHDPENLELYLCMNCQYLHIGHKRDAGT
jgi:hypothetical protein